MNANCEADNEAGDSPGAKAPGTRRLPGDRSFERIFAASPAPFLMLAPDSPQFTIVEVNDAYLDATMRTRADLIGKPIFEAFPDNPADTTATGTSNLRVSLERALATKRADRMPRQKYDVARPDGTFEERWWDPVNTPVLGETGQVCCIIHHVNDVTGQQRAETALRQDQARQAFLLNLSDAMRAETDAQSIISIATRELGEQLHASRIVYAEIDDDAGVAKIREGWTADGAERHPPIVQLTDFAGPLLDDLRAGKTVRYEDIGEPPYERPDLAALAAIGIQSGLSVPLIVSDRLVVNLNVHQDSPRIWTDSEVALTEAVAERTWAAVERARSEAELHESEHKYRVLFESIDQAVCVVEVIFDDAGTAVDYVFVEANPAFEGQTGLVDAVGKHMRELAPEHEEFWFETYGRIARTGVPERFENRAVALGRWYDVYAFRVDAPEDRRVAILFDDITDRKLAEESLREREEREAFLLRLSDLMRAQPDEKAVGEIGVRLLAEQFDLDRVYIATICKDEDRISVEPQYRRSDLQPVPALLRPTDFPQGFREVEEHGLIVDDLARDSRLSDEDKQSLGAIDLAAFVVAPLRQGKDHLVWALVAASAEPRHWRRADANVIQDAAERIWAAIDRARSEKALQASEEKYRRVVESAREYAMITLDRDGCIMGWNSGAERLLGYAEEEVVGRSGDIFFTPEDRATDKPEEEMRLADKEGRAVNERWHVRKDGSRFWGSGLMLPLEGQAGFLKIFRDGTAERLSDERQQLLIEELNHRVKNTLAIVQSLAQQTFRGDDVPALAREAFEGRLEALASAHNVLTREHWTSAELKDIARDAMEACHGSGERVSIDGPRIRLQPRTAVTMAMALHELCTNATKYGALSVPEGRVSVTWRVEDYTLLIRWEETGGPPVAPPRKRGFGSRMIERALASDMHAQVKLDYRPEGLVCTVAAPAPTVLDQETSIS